MGWGSEMLPVVHIDLDLDNLPTSSTRTWTSFRSRWRRIATRRGRQTMLDRVEPSTANVTLSNRDAALTPDNTVSPYYGGFDNLVPIRIWAAHATGDWPIFSGYTEDIDKDYPDNLDSIVNISCIDGGIAIRGGELNGAYPQERTDQRISRILDAVGWPSALRSLEVGKSSCAAQTFYNANPASQIDAAVDTEFGIFFFDASGIATFHNRHHRTANAAIAATFGGPAGLPYKDAKFTRPASLIWNRVTAQRIGGTEQTAEDTTSQGRYFQRNLSRSTQHTTDAEALSQAQMIVLSHKDPHTRVSPLMLVGRGDENDSLWEQMLGRELGDRIRIIRREPGSAAAGDGYGDTLQKDVWIERIDHDITQQGFDWKTKINTSPTDFWNFWLLATVGASEIGQTTRLGY